MTRVAAGNTDYLKLFKERCIIRRVHTIPRVFLFVPEQETLPSGMTFKYFTAKRRTVVQLAHAEHRDIYDDWSDLSAAGSVIKR